MNSATMVIAVHTPIVFRESLACSTAPELTSLAMSSIFRVASKPGNGRGSSTNHTRLKMMKYITPKNPANIDATIPTNANLRVSPEPRTIRGPSANEYCGSAASKKIAGNVKMNPVDACVAPVVADVAMLTSEGDHFKAIPNTYAIYQAADIANPSFSPIYAVTPEKTAPMAIPNSTFLVSQCETSNASSRFFSSKYCSRTPVLRLLYISSSSQVKVPFSIAFNPSGVTGWR